MIINPNGNPDQIAQGDVLFQRIKALPSGVKRKASGPIVVREGEQTGHHHVINSDKATLYELTHDGVTDLYLEVTEPVTIVHEEHKALPIPKGVYRIGAVKEYDYLAEMERAVID